MAPELCKASTRLRKTGVWPGWRVCHHAETRFSRDARQQTLVFDASGPTSPIVATQSPQTGSTVTLLAKPAMQLSQVEARPRDGPDCCWFLDYNSKVCYNVRAMIHELRTTILIKSFHSLSEIMCANADALTDLGHGFYVSTDGSTCFYMTRFISQNVLPPTEDFVDFARGCMDAISGGTFIELTD